MAALLQSLEAFTRKDGRASTLVTVGDKKWSFFGDFFARNGKQQKI